MTRFLRRRSTSPATDSRASDREARRAQRDARTKMLAELATYRTQAERTELELILARHSDADAAPVRALIG